MPCRLLRRTPSCRGLCAPSRLRARAAISPARSTPCSIPGPPTRRVRRAPNVPPAPSGAATPLARNKPNRAPSAPPMPSRNTQRTRQSPRMPQPRGRPRMANPLNRDPMVRPKLQLRPPPAPRPTRARRPTRSRRSPPRSMRPWSKPALSKPASSSEERRHSQNRRRQERRHRASGRRGRNAGCRRGAAKRRRPGAGRCRRHKAGRDPQPVAVVTAVAVVVPPPAAPAAAIAPAADTGVAPIASAAPAAPADLAPEAPAAAGRGACRQQGQDSETRRARTRCRSGRSVRRAQLRAQVRAEGACGCRAETAGTKGRGRQAQAWSVQRRSVSERSARIDQACAGHARAGQQPRRRRRPGRGSEDRAPGAHRGRTGRGTAQRRGRCTRRCSAAAGRNERSEQRAGHPLPPRAVVVAGRADAAARAARRTPTIPCRSPASRSRS